MTVENMNINLSMGLTKNVLPNLILFVTFCLLSFKQNPLFKQMDYGIAIIFHIIVDFTDYGIKHFC